MGITPNGHFKKLMDIISYVHLRLAVMMLVISVDQRLFFFHLASSAYLFSNHCVFKEFKLVSRSDSDRLKHH
jgi:hypothetical protein